MNYEVYRDDTVSLIERGHFQEAEGKLKLAIDEAKSNKNAIYYSLLNLLGYLYYNWEKYFEAIEQYDKVIDDSEKSDEKAYALIYRGLALYRKGNTKAAEKSYNDADNIFEMKRKTEKINDYSKSSYNLARVAIKNNLARIFIDEEKYSDAENEINEALDWYNKEKIYIDSLNNSNKKIQENVKTALLINRGILFYVQDENKKAREAFKEAIEYSTKYIKSPSSRAHYNLGNTYAKDGKMETAKDHYNKALEINPKMKEAKEALKNLKTVKEKIDWWNWWFDFKSKKGWAKGIVGSILLLLLIGIILNVAATTIIWTPTKYTEQSVTKINFNKQIQDSQQNTTNTTITKTKEVTPIGTDSQLLYAALILFILLHPIIKSFSAKEGKIEFESPAASKGSAPPSQ